VMNRITGLILLGPKENREKFTTDEIETLIALLGQTAFAFENAYLYQQQKTRLRKMYRADRLATLGQLAAGAAHEIRNPLTSIRSTIQYLQKDVQDEAKRNLVSELIGEVDRINEIIEGLLSFSKPNKLQSEDVDIESLIEQTLQLVRTSAMKSNIDVTLDFKAREKLLSADPSQLKQVFLNIIMNGIQAMENGGSLYISVDIRQTGDSSLGVKKSFFIEFRDSGAGIPREDLDHIFDPFFTTKKDGTGLGLSISYGIIQQHGGDIEIESFSENDKPGNSGTSVAVLLPITK